MSSLWRRFRNRKQKLSDNPNQGGFDRLVEDAGASRVSVTEMAPPPQPRRRNSAGENERRQDGKRVVRFASRVNLRESQNQTTTESPAPSRASSLSSTDLDYLNAQAFRTASPKPNPKLTRPPRPASQSFVRPPQQPSKPSASSPQVDWEAFSGAFAPQPRLYPSRYPEQTLTPQQLRDLEGAYAPSPSAPAYYPAVTFQ
ncbi:hypothetical protein VTL71DRAFT_14964 [Oculimacula yallundae]|uniref:Uncharacterized protein n=1 Tax=Oculimacula yallundae TaxID=86028 RepID=A0ABR4CGI4_9HELO